MLELPLSLNRLIDAGRWPRTSAEANSQNLNPLVPLDRIKKLAPEEHSLYLFPPPFATVKERADQNKFWLDRSAAPSEIDFDLALDIGDFGIGSDAPIILDYRVNRAEPRVLRLRWSSRGNNNHWVETASTFDIFAEILGLLPIN